MLDAVIRALERDQKRRPYSALTATLNILPLTERSCNVATIAELAAKCGKQRGGDARRLMDVPIYFDGLDHIFDRVPKADQVSQSELQSLYSSIRTACAKNHGYIFAQYIKFLIRSEAGLRDRIAKHVRRFRTHVTDNGGKIVHTDIIRKFGLIYAGSALAKTPPLHDRHRLWSDPAAIVNPP
jgi:hypothetical protein